MEFYDFDSWGNQPTSAEEELEILLHGVYTASVPPFIQQEIDALRATDVADDAVWQAIAEGTKFYLMGEAALTCLQEAIYTAMLGGPIRLQAVLVETIECYPEIGEELVNYIDDLRHLRY